MNAWRLAIFGLAWLAAAAGCRTDPTITALERENRDLEDEIYQLQDCLDRTQDTLDKCRAGKTETRKGEASPLRKLLEPSSGQGAEPALPPAVRGPELSPLQGRARPPVGPEELKLPQVDIPTQPLEQGKSPGTLQGPGTKPSARPPARGQNRRFEDEDAPDLPPNPPVPSPKSPESNAPKKLRLPGNSNGTVGRADAEADPASPSGVMPATALAIEASADSRQVQRIALDPSLTGGCDLDQRPGDDGIRVVVEPRDAQGRPIAAAASMTVVLLDGALSGDEARFARWDLDADQVAGLYRQTPRGEGFWLELPWPENPPAHSRLHLFVRYTTRDGRQLESDGEIEINRTVQPSKQWSAAAPRPTRTAAISDPGTPAPSGVNGPAAEVTSEPAARQAIARPIWSPNRR